MRLSFIVPALGVVAILCGLSVAADDPNTFTDPAKAGPDYAVQGEYVGSVGSDMKYGAQVIADGEGKFTVKLLQGGLPGAGWDGKTSMQGSAVTADGKVTVNGKDFSGAISDGKLALKMGSKDFTLSKTERKSETLGLKPPEGAIILFDGTSADAWNGGKLVDGKYLNNGITSKQAFNDHTIHIEFLLPFMPKARGQGRANSGVYVQDRYELQILDSFGLKGLNNECGGFYQAADPLVNMCLPPLVWQTYDIDFQTARFDGGKKVKDAIVTVRHNGVPVHENLALKKPTPGGKDEKDAGGPIQLQNHGNPVVFRNIWVVEKK
jgi:hypothetical protein